MSPYPATLKTDWINTVNHDYRLVVLLAEDVTSWLPQAVETICHISKYWDATDAQREQVKLMAKSAEATERMVLFKLSLDVEPTEGAAFADLVKAVAEKCDGKKLLMQKDHEVKMIECHVAEGGYREEVIRRLEEIKLANASETPAAHEAPEASPAFGETPS